MANAAAKKAAAARKSARQFYYPLLLILNGLFVALRIFLVGWAPRGWPELLVWAMLVALQYYSFFGILDHASNNANKSNDGKLVGGSYLDLLAATLLIQFIGGLVWSPIYWVCMAFPIWGGYSVYSTMFKNNPTVPSSQTTESATSSTSTVPTSNTSTSVWDRATDAVGKRRQKRVERRQNRKK